MTNKLVIDPRGEIPPITSELLNFLERSFPFQPITDDMSDRVIFRNAGRAEIIQFLHDAREARRKTKEK